MNPTKTSFVTAAGVTLAALSVVYGGYIREALDNDRPFNHPTLTEATTPGLEVSTRQIPEDDFYRGLVRLLKREYVEPITDERKLAIGAVKGMVDSLHDPRSVYMDSDEFRVFNNATEGKYEGIGVDLAFDNVRTNVTPQGGDSTDPNALLLPTLRVVAVTPGGPADHAGVKAGDTIEYVESHWVLDPAPLVEFRKLLATLDAQVVKGLTPEQLKVKQQTVWKTGKALRAKLDTMIYPARARDMLTIGSKGAVSVVWLRDGTERPTTITRKESQVPVVQSEGDTIALRFAEGAAEKLRHAIGTKTDVTLDLRNNSNGDFKAMEECLAAVAPSGTYGYVTSQKPGKSHKFVVDNGNTRPPHMTILVDPTTRGAADIFATALSAKHFAKLVGTPSKDRSVVEIVPLPDGSGYTLVTGEYAIRESARKTVAIRSDKPPTPVAMRDADGSIVAMGDTGGNA
jgi:C-terminal processing protease CtpA/Prc